MRGSTAVDRMRDAMRRYRIDQPDSYTVAIYGPDDFCEIHDSFSCAFERKEELAILAALKAIAVPSKAMVDAGEQAMKSGRAEAVWQAFLEVIIADYETNGGRMDELISDPKNDLVRSI